jgi:hypothetical protein
MQGRIQQLHAFRTSGIRLPVRSIWAWVEWLARLGLSPWASVSTLHSTATALAQVCLLPGNGLGPSTVTTFAHHAPRIPTKKCWLADQQYFQIKRSKDRLTK